jgi:hypothetical protein
MRRIEYEHHMISIGLSFGDGQMINDMGDQCFLAAVNSRSRSVVNCVGIVCSRVLAV